MSDAEIPTFVGAARGFETGIGATVPACPPLVVVTVFDWFQVCVPELETFRPVLPFTWDVLRVLVPPFEKPVTVLVSGVHAGNPDVPTPGSVPGGQLMTVDVPVAPLVRVNVFADVFVPVLPLARTDDTAGVGTVVTCALINDVSRVMP
jgi:hypothetical protein